MPTSRALPTTGTRLRRARERAEQAEQDAALALVREATDRYYGALQRAEYLRLDQAEAIRRAIRAGTPRRLIAPHAARRGQPPLSRRHVDRIAALLDPFHGRPVAQSTTTTDTEAS